MIAALIERLEKATAADRDLGAYIAVATTATVKTDDDLIYARLRDPGNDGTHPGHYFIKSRSGAEARTAPHFTSSIDAALTLVPEGFFLDLHDWTWAEEPCWNAALQTAKPDTARVHVHGRGTTAALALCIAALKARAALAETQP